MAPSSRIILALLGVTSVGLLLCAAIIYGSLDRLSLRTAEANTDFLLTQLRDTIEANVGLGLPLSDIRLAQDLIERAAATDKQVLAVEVFSPAGISLFNTDRGSIGEPISAAWQETISYRIENDRWRVEELGNLVVGHIIRNDFGEPIGHVAITISGEGRRTLGRAVLAGLAQDGAILAPVALLVLLLIGAAVFNFTDRDVRRIADELDSGTGFDSPQRRGLSDEGENVRSSIDQAAAAFGQAAAAVSQIDENEDRDAA